MMPRGVGVCRGEEKEDDKEGAAIDVQRVLEATITLFLAYLCDNKRRSASELVGWLEARIWGKDHEDWWW